MRLLAAFCCSSFAALLLATSSVSFAMQVETTNVSASALPDPQGDTFGSPLTSHDIAAIEATLVGSTVLFTVELYQPIAPASAFAANSLVGFIDIDLDQNPATGSVAKKTLFSPMGDNALGSEFHIDLFSERFHPGEVEVVASVVSQPVGRAPIVFVDSGFSVAVPLDLLAGDAAFNWGIIVGDFLDMSDQAPNEGFATLLVPEASGCMTAVIGCLMTYARRRRAAS